MDKARQLIIATCSSLSRLQLRLLHKSWQFDYSSPERINCNPYWTVADVDPPSVWLSSTLPHMALSGAIHQVALITAHLLTMVETPGDIDGLNACVVLQSISAMAWSKGVQRLANQLEISLPEMPVMASYGAPLSESLLPPVRNIFQGR